MNSSEVHNFRFQSLRSIQLMRSELLGINKRINQQLILFIRLMKHKHREFNQSTISDISFGYTSLFEVQNSAKDCGFSLSEAEMLKIPEHCWCAAILEDHKMLFHNPLTRCTGWLWNGLCDIWRLELCTELTIQKIQSALVRRPWTLAGQIILMMADQLMVDFLVLVGGDLNSEEIVWVQYLPQETRCSSGSEFRPLVSSLDKFFRHFYKANWGTAIWEAWMQSEILDFVNAS